MQNEDKIFFRNFSYVVSGLAILMLFFLITARTIAIPDSDDVIDTAAVDERTQFVGELHVAGEAGDGDTSAEPALAEAASTGGDTPGSEAEAVVAAADAASGGEKVYQGLCVSCHGTGLPGVPQLGDAAAWEARVAQGMDTVYSNAIKGFTGASGIPMPPKGDNPALSDDEVKAAVDYMIEASK